MTSLQMTPTCSESKSIGLLSPQRTRKRGVVLTQHGWQKLIQAEAICNSFGERYTFEYLSEQAQLDSRTVCRIVGRETPVDKRSLKIFFNAFSLELQQIDYTKPNDTASSLEMRQTDSETVAPFPFPRLALVPDADLSIDDTSLLKQHIIEACRRFIQLHRLEQAGSITLSVKFMPQTLPQLELHL